MRIAYGFSAALIAGAGIAIGSASPAWADDFGGSYRFDSGGPSTWSTWTVTPCGPGCADVAATGGSNWAPYGGQARLTGSEWTMLSPWPDAGMCNGTPVTGTRNLTWNADSLSGTGTADSAASTCAPAKTEPFSFTLTKLP
jgi:hypothetical protein